jgi:hypothetical protein
MKRTVLALAAALVAVPALAFSQGPADKQGHVPPAGAPAPSPEALKPLPEITGVVSWKTLGQVQVVKVGTGRAQFSDGVLKLNATEVKLQGFRMPLEMGDKRNTSC